MTERLKISCLLEKIPPYNFLGIFSAKRFGPYNARYDVLILPSLNYAWTQFCLLVK